MFPWANQFICFTIVVILFIAKRKKIKTQNRFETNGPTKICKVFSSISFLMKEKPAHFDNPVSTIPLKFHSRLSIPWCNSNLLFMSGHLGKWCADKMIREWWFCTDFPLNFDASLCKINSSNICKFLYSIFYFLKAKIPTKHY